MRGFYLAKDKDGNDQYPEAQLPLYKTKYSAGADFFCAEKVTVPSIWTMVFSSVSNRLSNVANALIGHSTDGDTGVIKPTIVHTGVKADMEEDEVLELYNRSSNPGKLGLILANSVGVVDKDYFGCVANDGEIMFSFYNFMPWSVTIEVGDRIGQGVFKKYLRPIEGLRVDEVERTGGHGSTDEPSAVSLEKKEE